jgi:MFS family permease
MLAPVLISRAFGSHPPDLVAVFLRWTFARAFLHRGWWLVTSVYLIVDAGLGPAELVAIAIGQGLTCLLLEIPAGVVADIVSRQWSLVISHVLMGSAMLTTGLVTDFSAIIATQMLWGLSWTFAGGADVAWLTDELAQPERVPTVLVLAGRTQLLGSAAGIVVLGMLGSAIPRAATMILAGAAMVVLGLYVVFRFREERFVPVRSRRWKGSWSVLTAGLRLARSSRILLVVFAATVLVNVAHQSGRLHQLRLVEVGFPAEPLVWFAGLSVTILLVGAAALRVVETRVHPARTTPLTYALGCASGAIGLGGLAIAPGPVTAATAVLVTGTADPIARTVSTIWVNQNATSNVRATMHSFLSQTEYLGAILGGAAITVIAAAGGTAAALLFCAGLFATTTLLARLVR